MSATAYFTRNYENNVVLRLRKNKPNSKPIQSQNKPKVQTCPEPCRRIQIFKGSKLKRSKQRQKWTISQQEYDGFVKPYDNKGTVDEIRRQLGDSTEVQ
jgi:hypothetical protein